MIECEAKGEIIGEYSQGLCGFHDSPPTSKLSSNPSLSPFVDSYRRSNLFKTNGAWNE